MDSKTKELWRQVVAGAPELAPQLISAVVRSGDTDRLPEVFELISDTDLEAFFGTDAIGRVAVAESLRRDDLGTMGEGRRVEYTRGPKFRARARWGNPGHNELVPKGTKGIITSMSATQDYRSQYGTWSNGRATKIRIEAEDGRVFWTYTRNVKLLDTWEDVDTRNRGKIRKAATEVELWATFTKPSRGATITMVDQNNETVTGAVFWVGSDGRAVGALRDVAWRVGLRISPNARPYWGNGKDVLQIEGRATIQAAIKREVKNNLEPCPASEILAVQPTLTKGVIL